MDEDRASGEAVRMTIVEHLTELRRRIIIAAVAVAAGAIAAFVLYDRILEVLIDPYCRILPPDRSCSLVITAPLEGFSARLKVAGYGGLFLASPVVLWQLWRFITPGLHPHEKRWAVPFVGASVVLFALGAGLALYTFPRALDFVITVSGEQVTTLFSPEKYITFILRVILGFGIAFEFPLVLVFLQLAGVVSSRRLLRSWRWAIVIIFAIAAVITPSQDPWTLAALAGPLSVFYFGAIGLGRLLKR